MELKDGILYGFQYKDHQAACQKHKLPGHTLKDSN